MEQGRNSFAYILLHLLVHAGLLIHAFPESHTHLFPTSGDRILRRVYRQAEDGYEEYPLYQYEEGDYPEYGSQEYYDYDGSYYDNSEGKATEPPQEEESRPEDRKTTLHPTYKQVQDLYEEEQKRLEEEQRRLEEELRLYEEQEISYEEESGHSRQETQHVSQETHVKESQEEGGDQTFNGENFDVTENDEYDSQQEFSYPTGDDQSLHHEQAIPIQESSLEQLERYTNQNGEQGPQDHYTTEEYEDPYPQENHQNSYDHDNDHSQYSHEHHPEDEDSYENDEHQDSYESGQHAYRNEHEHQVPYENQGFFEQDNGRHNHEHEGAQDTYDQGFHTQDREQYSYGNEEDPYRDNKDSYDQEIEENEQKSKAYDLYPKAHEDDQDSFTQDRDEHYSYAHENDQHSYSHEDEQDPYAHEDDKDLYAHKDKNHLYSHESEEDPYSEQNHDATELEQAGYADENEQNIYGQEEDDLYQDVSEENYELPYSEEQTSVEEHENNYYESEAGQHVNPNLFEGKGTDLKDGKLKNDEFEESNPENEEDYNNTQEDLNLEEITPSRSYDESNAYNYEAEHQSRDRSPPEEKNSGDSFGEYEVEGYSHSNSQEKDYEDKESYSPSPGNDHYSRENEQEDIYGSGYQRRSEEIENSDYATEQEEPYMIEENFKDEIGQSRIEDTRTTYENEPSSVESEEGSHSFVDNIEHFGENGGNEEKYHNEFASKGQDKTEDSSSGFDEGGEPETYETQDTYGPYDEENDSRTDESSVEHTGADSLESSAYFDEGVMNEKEREYNENYDKYDEGNKEESKSYEVFSGETEHDDYTTSSLEVDRLSSRPDSAQVDFNIENESIYLSTVEQETTEQIDRNNFDTNYNRYEILGTVENEENQTFEETKPETLANQDSDNGVHEADVVTSDDRFNSQEDQYDSRERVENEVNHGSHDGAQDQWEQENTEKHDPRNTYGRYGGEEDNTFSDSQEYIPTYGGRNENFEPQFVTTSVQSPVLEQEQVNLSKIYAAHDSFERISETTKNPIQEVINSADSQENYVHETDVYEPSPIQCYSGYKLSEDGVQCVDVNECMSEDACGSNQSCENVPGSYACTCHPGFQKYHRSSKDCKDINECEIENGGCNQDCINTKGSYFCSCSDEFRLEGDGKTCVKQPTTTTTTTTMIPPVTSVLSSELLTELTTEAARVPTAPHISPVLEVKNCPTPPVPRGRGIAYLYCSRSPIGIHHRHSQLERRLLKDWAAKINKSRKSSNRNIARFRRRRHLRKRARQTTYSPGSVCELRCRPGYQMQGKYKLYCNSTTGDWQGSTDGFCSALVNIESNQVSNNPLNRISNKISQIPPTLRTPSTTFRPTYYPPPPASRFNSPVESSSNSLFEHSPKTPQPTEPIAVPTTKVSTTTTTTTTPVTRLPYYYSSTSAPKHYAPKFPYRGGESQSSLPQTTPSSYKPFTYPPPAPRFTTSTASPQSQTNTTHRNYIQMTYRFNKPWIKCPDNMMIDLPPGKNMAYISLPHPETNVDWWRQVTSEPAWAKNLETELGPGKQIITFRARGTVSHTNSAECSFTLEVRDAEPPRVRECPEPFSIRLNPGQSARTVTWTEPMFTDNVRISSLKKSHEPGTVMATGEHLINYEAVDTSDNRAKCFFTINVLPSLSNGYQRPYGAQTDVTLNPSPRPEVHAKLRKVVCYVGRKGKRIVFQSRVIPKGCSEMTVDVVGDTSQGSFNTVNTIVQNSAENSATSQISSVSFSSQDKPPSSSAFSQAVSNGRNTNRLVHSTSSVTNGAHGPNSKASSYAVAISSSSRNFALPFITSYNKQIYEEEAEENEPRNHNHTTNDAIVDNNNNQDFIVPIALNMEDKEEPRFRTHQFSSNGGRRTHWGAHRSYDIHQTANYDTHNHPNRPRHQAQNIILDSTNRRSNLYNRDEQKSGRRYYKSKNDDSNLNGEQMRHAERNKAGGERGAHQQSNSNGNYRKYFRHFDSWDSLRKRK